MGVVGAVDGSGGDVSHFACGKNAFFLADPLFSAAIEDIDDFLTMRVVVEGMAVARGHVGADQKEFFGVDEVRAAEPFVVCPGIDFAGGVVDLDEAICGRVGHEERRAVTRPGCNSEWCTWGYPRSTRMIWTIAMQRLSDDKERGKKPYQ